MWHVISGPKCIIIQFWIYTVFGNSYTVYTENGPTQHANSITQI